MTRPDPLSVIVHTIVTEGFTDVAKLTDDIVTALIRAGLLRISDYAEACMLGDALFERVENGMNTDDIRPVAEVAVAWLRGQNFLSNPA